MKRCYVCDKETDNALHLQYADKSITGFAYTCQEHIKHCSICGMDYLADGLCACEATNEEVIEIATNVVQLSIVEGRYIPDIEGAVKARIFAHIKRIDFGISTKCFDIGENVILFTYDEGKLILADKEMFGVRYLVETDEYEYEYEYDELRVLTAPFLPDATPEFEQKVVNKRNIFKHTRVYETSEYANELKFELYKEKNLEIYAFIADLLTIVKAANSPFVFVDVRTANIRQFDNRHVSYDCLYFMDELVCSHCNVTIHEHDDYVIEDGKPYCEDCQHNCEICGDKFYGELAHDRFEICEFCADSINECEDCGKLDTLEADLVFAHNTYLCDDCLRKRKEKDITCTDEAIEFFNEEEFENAQGREVIKDKTFSDVDFSKLEIMLEKFRLENCVFINCKYGHQTLADVLFDECDFSFCTFHQMAIADVEFICSDVFNCTFTNVVFSNSQKWNGNWTDNRGYNNQYLANSDSISKGINDYEYA